MDVDELTSAVTALQATVDQQMEQIKELKDGTPAKEQLFVTANFPVWNAGAVSITTANRFTLMVAPIPLRVLSVAMSLEYGSVAASDTNYWTGIIESGRDGAFPDIVTKTTRITGSTAGGGIAARVPWSWESGVWNAESAILGKGDLLAVNWTPSGTPAALRFPQSYVIRCFPL